MTTVPAHWPPSSTRKDETSNRDWHGVFAECLEDGCLIQADGTEIRLPGSEDTYLTVTGWSPANAAIRMRSEGEGVGHPPGIAQKRELLRIADYVLFAEVKGKQYVLILEMKKQVGSGDTRPYEQVRRTRPVAAYLERLARDEGPPSSREINPRHVVVAAEAGGRIPKSPAKRRPFQPEHCWKRKGVGGWSFLGTRFPLRALIKAPPT